MAKLEIQVRVYMGESEEIINELKHLQTYKLFEGDDMVLVDCDKVVEIFADHLRAEIRSDSTVELDPSSYSDKLWRDAYERGRAEAEAEQHWIPCSERLPEEHEWMGTKRFGTTISDEVYVTFENPKGERFCKHLSFQNGKLSGFDQSTIDAFYKGSKPIAWMPLPEPYKAERREE